MTVLERPSGFALAKARLFGVHSTLPHPSSISVVCWESAPPSEAEPLLHPPHSFQPSFFSIASHSQDFWWFATKIPFPGKNGEVAPRLLPLRTFPHHPVRFRTPVMWSCSSPKASGGLLGSLPPDQLKVLSGISVYYIYIYIDIYIYICIYIHICLDICISLSLSL